MKVGQSGWRINRSGIQGDETEGGALVSFSQSSSVMSPYDIRLRGGGERTKRQKDREETVRNVVIVGKMVGKQS